MTTQQEIELSKSFGGTGALTPEQRAAIGQTRTAFTSTSPQNTIPGQMLTGYTPEESQAMTAAEQELLRGGSYTKDASGAFVRGAEPTEADARTRATALFQGQIDALEAEKAAARGRISQYYKPVHEQRLGAQRALMANSGMLGQVSGQSQKSQLESANVQELTSAQAQSDASYNTKIAELQTGIRTEASKFYDEQKKAYEGKAKDLIEFLNNKNTLRQTGLSNVIKQALSLGIDLEKDTTTLEQTAKDLGASKEQVLSAYKEGKKAKEASDQKAQLELRKTLADIGKSEIDIKKAEADISKTKAEIAKLSSEAGSKQEKELYDDISKMQESLSTGKTDWGQAWNFIQDKYSVPPERYTWLDEILNKNIWGVAGAYQQKVLGGTPQGSMILRTGM